MTGGAAACLEQLFIGVRGTRESAAGGGEADGNEFHSLTPWWWFENGAF
jgi:hypothetical protein